MQLRMIDKGNGKKKQSANHLSKQEKKKKKKKNKNKELNICI